jgi:membrane protease YdiL (CAAX protease family)
MSNDSSKERAESREQRAESASGEVGPDSVTETAQDNQANKQSHSELTPHDSALTPKKVPWSPWAAVLYALALYFVAQIVAGLLVGIYPLMRHWDKLQTNEWLSSSIAAQFFFVLLAEALIFGALWWFIKHRKSSLRVIGWRRPHIRDGLFTLCGYAIYFVAYVVLLAVAMHLVPNLNVGQTQDTGFQGATGSGALLLTFISLVILPPLVEETLFRGFIFSGLKNNLPVVWAAVGTSLLFAIAHLQFGSGKPLLWVAAIDTFTLSLVLCWLREQTDGLWAGIGLHALKNGVAFASLFLLHVH